jgi:hypothetical protein
MHFNGGICFQKLFPRSEAAAKNVPDLRRNTPYYTTRSSHTLNRAHTDRIRRKRFSVVRVVVVMVTRISAVERKRKRVPANPNIADPHFRK